MIIISGKAKSGKTQKLISFINGSNNKNFYIVSKEHHARYYAEKIVKDKLDNVRVNYSPNLECNRIIGTDYIVIDSISESQIEEFKTKFAYSKSELILLVQESNN